MIKDRTRYQFVNIPYSIKVNGEVMPLRAEDDKKILRGEDIAFLLESVERKHKMIGNTTISRTLDRRIAGGYYTYVIDCLKRMARDNYFVHDISLSDYYDIVEGDSEQPIDRVPNYKVDKSELKGNEYYFQTG